jgi:ribosomal protein S18 acetylase RimI-like enzyme
VSVTVRVANVHDAAAVLGLLRRVIGEPGVNIPLQPDEITATVEEQRAVIEELADEPRAVMLVAEIEGAIVGELSLRPMAPRRALAHVAVLGISVDAGWRGRGVGSALMTHAIAWAERAGYLRIELNVYARNTAAIRLYERFGFVLEGRRRKLIREGDVFLDDLVMARLSR